MMRVWPPPPYSSRTWGQRWSFLEQGVQEANAFPVHLRVARGMPPFRITSSYVLWPRGMSRACHSACRVLYNLQRFLFPHGAKISSLLHPCSANISCPQNSTDPPEEKPRQDSGLGLAAASTRCPPLSAALKWAPSPAPCTRNSRIGLYSPKQLPGWRGKLGSCLQGERRGPLSRCRQRSAPRKAGFLFCNHLLGKG